MIEGVLPEAFVHGDLELSLGGFHLRIPQIAVRNDMGEAALKERPALHPVFLSKILPFKSTP